MNSNLGLGIIFAGVSIANLYVVFYLLDWAIKQHQFIWWFLPTAILLVIAVIVFALISIVRFVKYFDVKE